jgi:hypothetical protein
VCRKTQLTQLYQTYRETKEDRWLKEAARIVHVILQCGESKSVGAEPWSDITLVMALILAAEAEFLVHGRAVTDETFGQFTQICKDSLALNGGLEETKHLLRILQKARPTDVVSRLYWCDAMLTVSCVLLDHCPKMFLGYGRQKVQMPDGFWPDLPDKLDMTEAVIQTTGLAAVLQLVVGQLESLTAKTEVVRNVHVKGSRHGLLAKALYQQAQVEFLCLGKPDKAIKALEKADKQAELACGFGHACILEMRFTQILSAQIHIHLCRGDFKSALSVAERAAELTDRPELANHFLRTRALFEAAKVAALAGQSSEALAYELAAVTMTARLKTTDMFKAIAEHVRDVNKRLCVAAHK